MPPNPVLYFLALLAGLAGITLSLILIVPLKEYLERHLPPSVVRFLIRARARLPELMESAANFVFAYLYDANLPWRSIRIIVKILIAILVLGFVYFDLVPSAISYIMPFLRFLLGLSRETVGGLVFLGNKLGLSSEFATYITAQVLADLVSVVVIAFIAIIGGYLLYGKIQRGLQFPTHNIRIEKRQVTRTDENGVTTLYVRVSNEDGDEPAINCGARIVFNGITWRDIVEVPSARTEYSVARLKPITNYFKTTSLRFELPWEDGLPKRTLLSGDDALLPVLKLVPARNGVPEHFEVPSIVWTLPYKGVPSLPDVRVGVCLRPLTEYGLIRIVPERGRFRRTKFTVYESQGSWNVG